MTPSQRAKERVVKEEKIVMRRTRRSTRRGLFYEDEQRIVQVVALSGGNLGVGLRSKAKEGITQKFAISTDGAKILMRFMRAVMEGKGKQIRDGLEEPITITMQWTQVTPDKIPAEEAAAALSRKRGRKRG